MRKKYKLSFILLSCLFTLAFSQETQILNPKNFIGISFSSFGANPVFPFQSLDGAASYNEDGFYTIGFVFLHPVSKAFGIETGFEYSNHKIIVEPNVPPEVIAPPYGTGFSLISIPLNLRVGFARYFFISGGVFMDIDASIDMPVDSQTGLGINIGTGFTYTFDFGLTTFINPYIKAHSLIPFTKEQNQQHLMESGFRLGLLYNLK